MDVVEDVRGPLLSELVLPGEKEYVNLMFYTSRSVSISGSLPLGQSFAFLPSLYSYSMDTVLGSGHTHTHTHTLSLTRTHREIASVMSDSFLGDIAANGEACGAVRILALHDAVAPRDGHVVDHPLLHVVLVDTVVKKPHLPLIILSRLGIVLPAQELALLHRFPKFDLAIEEKLDSIEIEASSKLTS